MAVEVELKESVSLKPLLTDGLRVAEAEAEAATWDALRWPRGWRGCVCSSIPGEWGTSFI